MVRAASLLKNSLKRSIGVYVLSVFSLCPGGLAGTNFLDSGHTSGSSSVFQEVAEYTGFGLRGDPDVVLVQPLDNRRARLDLDPCALLCGGEGDRRLVRLRALPCWGGCSLSVET